MGQRGGSSSVSSAAVLRTGTGTLCLFSSFCGLVSLFSFHTPGAAALARSFHCTQHKKKKKETKKRSSHSCQRSTNSPTHARRPRDAFAAFGFTHSLSRPIFALTRPQPIGRHGPRLFFRTMRVLLSYLLYRLLLFCVALLSLPLLFVILSLSVHTSLLFSLLTIHIVCQYSRFCAYSLQIAYSLYILHQAPSSKKKKKLSHEQPHQRSQKVVPRLVERR